jgi:hypothetical protein
MTPLSWSLTVRPAPPRNAPSRHDGSSSPADPRRPPARAGRRATLPFPPRAAGRASRPPPARRRSARRGRRAAGASPSRRASGRRACDRPRPRSPEPPGGVHGCGGPAAVGVVAGAPQLLQPALEAADLHQPALLVGLRYRAAALPDGGELTEHPSGAGQGLLDPVEVALDLVARRKRRPRGLDRVREGVLRLVLGLDEALRLAAELARQHRPAVEHRQLRAGDAATVHSAASTTRCPRTRLRRRSPLRLPVSAAPRIRATRVDVKERCRGGDPPVSAVG